MKHTQAPSRTTKHTKKGKTNNDKSYMYGNIINQQHHNTNRQRNEHKKDKHKHKNTRHQTHVQQTKDEHKACNTYNTSKHITPQNKNTLGHQKHVQLHKT